MKDKILFYGKSRPYFEFSNFFVAPFKDCVGTQWPTVEHYFQAQKFSPESMTYSDDGMIKPIRLHILNQLTPGKAAKEGRRRDLPMRADWNDEAEGQSDYFKGFLVKDLKMYSALRYKFTQHHKLEKLLLDTGEKEIIEDSPIDWYWGVGKDCAGKNMLGILLMKLREELKNR